MTNTTPTDRALYQLRAASSELEKMVTVLESAHWLMSCVHDPTHVMIAAELFMDSEIDRILAYLAAAKDVLTEADAKRSMRDIKAVSTDE